MIVWLYLRVSFDGTGTMKLRLCGVLVDKFSRFLFSLDVSCVIEKEGIREKSRTSDLFNGKVRAEFCKYEMGNAVAASSRNHGTRLPVLQWYPKPA